jgi:hypothetical protein
MKSVKLAIISGFLILLTSTAYAQSSVLVVNANGDNNSELNAALGVQFNTVDNHEVNSLGNPTLNQLSAYNTVLAYTNSAPADPVGLGNVLADYVDAGGCVIVSTYGLSNPWAITGRMQDSGYTPLTNLGSNGDISGNLVALVPNDPIFSGVNLGVLTYFHNSNFAYPGLDAGATLVADDGAGHNMIARNANGNVIGMNLFPADDSENNAELYALYVNAAANCAGFVVPAAPVAQVPANNVYALILLMLLLSGVAYTTIRRYH